jgi:hypothetical protein
MLKFFERLMFLSIAHGDLKEATEHMEDHKCGVLLFLLIGSHSYDAAEYCVNASTNM